MTEDYQALQDFSGQKLILWVFTKYKNLIRKKAYLYSRVARGRIDVDDFMSDVYLNLVYYIKFIDIAKTNSEKFMFYIYVTYAISRTLKQYKEDCVCVSIEQNDLDNYLVASEEQFCFCECNLDQFYKCLSKRQVEVLRLRQNRPNITYKELGALFGVRLQTIVRDVQLAKEKYNNMFGTHFQIGRQKKEQNV